MTSNSVHPLILKLVSLLQRRCSLEDWIEKLLSDIDISRSVLVATFIELEAAARSCRCIFLMHFIDEFYYVIFFFEYHLLILVFGCHTFQHSMIHSKFQM